MGQVIGILGTGDMGSAVGRVLAAAGHRVVTALDGRSAASRRLAEAAGLEDLGTLEHVLGECALFLSILPPARAAELAEQAAAIVRRRALTVLYADCNAVAPATLAAIARHFEGTGGGFVDVGIVGPAPRTGSSSPTRFYVAGPGRDPLLALRVPELAMIDMGPAAGRASAIKMCYAALNKGVDALYTSILLAARRLDVEAELLREFETSQAEAAARMARRVPFLAAAAERYVGEMAEIAATFEAAGVTGEFHRGAGWLYTLLARSALGSETRATVPEERALAEAIDAFAAALDD